MPNPTCASCLNWQGRATDYMATCAIVSRRTAFDDACSQHAPHPAPAMQSQARGTLPPMSGIATGAKP